MARVCLFDVNETLLDLGALDPHFERAFGDAGVRRVWFLQLLQSALVATVTGAYSDFGQVGEAALEMVAERQGVQLTDEDRDLILGGMLELPPHPEVAESLERLRDAGLRLATLTNSTQQVAEAQMDSSRLRPRAVPHGRREPRGRSPECTPDRRPRLGRGGLPARRLRGGLRSAPGDGARPLGRAPGRGRLRPE